MFESKQALADDILGLLDSLRRLGQGRYSCIMEPGRILFENPQPEDAADWTLRRFLEERSRAAFTIPAALAAGGPEQDVFEGWDHDDFFLAFLNGRVAIVVACPEAEPLRESAGQALRALADRLFRFDETWRLDPQGRGFFMGRARLDIVVVGRSSFS